MKIKTKSKKGKMDTKEQSLFYTATTFRPHMDGKHKSIVRRLIKDFKCSWLENKEGEKIIFFAVKKKDIDGKVKMPCLCGCSKPFGIMETLTEKQMKDRFPQVYYNNPFCWKCESKKVVGKKTFWDKGKDELITFFICQPCEKNTTDKVLNNGMIKKGREADFTFEPVHCNKCDKKLWTDWKSRERVEMYKNNELFYLCSNCVVERGDKTINKVMKQQESQGAWIALNINEYEVIKYKEQHDLDMIAENIKYNDKC